MVLTSRRCQEGTELMTNTGLHRSRPTLHICTLCVHLLTKSFQPSDEHGSNFLHFFECMTDD